ncbi:MAG: PEGA domain-containing protein [Ignavibacteriales bacterium]|nr:PEGA domain-containing protein [Ignavibacteriales bacterium]
MLSNNKYFYVFALLIILVFLTACEKELSNTPPEKPADKGRLIVSSYPAGAGIYLNEKKSGYFTPDSMTWLNEGTYKLVLRKDYYKDTALYIEMPKDGKVEVFVDYLKNPRMYGTIECTSTPPGAEILVDDSSTGIITPARVTGIRPGIRKITFKKQGFWNTSLRYNVYSSTITTADFALDDTSKWVTYTTLNSGIPTDEITCVTTDKNSHVWAGSESLGLIYYDWKEWKIFNKDNSPLPSNYVLTLKYDYFGKLWIGTDEGIAIYDNGSWEILNSANTGMPIDYVSSIDVDSTGNALVGTKSGLVRLYNGRWILLNSSNSKLPATWVAKVKFQPNRNLWASVVKTCLASFNSIKWSTYGLPDPDDLGGSWKEIPPNVWKEIIAIDFLKSGEGFFGASVERSIFVLLYENGAWKTVLSLGDNTVNNIFCSEDNYVWIGTQKGLLRYKKNVSPTISFDPKSSGLKSYYITGVTEAPNKVMWISTHRGGLTKYKRFN